ncbi:MAG: ABC transporter ATP-binding protein/permease [Spirochaetaceae bacterium]|jgi:ATP-binding cassette subfamily B protein|nr:ABC transporter ATP-binding protein/permease [Spirochaetaceae bacterium]
MADYFETEEVVKGYDKGIALRMLSYLKPYRALVALALIALAISTIGELAIPVIQQRLIDDAIIPRFLSINYGNNGNNNDDNVPRSWDVLSEETRDTLQTVLAQDNARSIGAYRFVPQNQNTRLSARVEAELKEARILDGTQHYVFTVSDTAAENVIAQYPDRFISEEHDGVLLAAIRNADLYALKVLEIAAIRAHDIGLIKRIVLLLLSILVCVFVFAFIQTWTSNLIGQRVMKDIRLALFQKTASQSTAFLSRHPVGRIVTRLSGDVGTINEFFTSVLVAFLKDLAIMIGVLITLFLLSPKLALVVVLTMLPVLAITAYSRAKARDAFRRQRTASSRVNSYLSERLSGVQVVQLFGGEKQSGEEFASRNQELLHANLGEMYVLATFRPLVEWFGTLTAAAIIVVGSNFVLSLSLSLGVLIAFISLAGMFFNPLMDIAEKYTLLQSAMAGGERVFTLLDTNEHIGNEGRHSIEGMVRGHIAFDNVRFSYKQGEAVLKGLSFTVNPGEMAAIVGYTGAGKTTITNVLARLWDIDGGEIRLDGVPLKDIPLDELRRSVLPVLQDVFLFSGSVADNIRLGLPLTDAEVEAAAKAVHAHEFISALPDGYQTPLSEGATNISSGQRQLISFARVIAHNPAIVILDEATSSIDTETERLIQLGMQRVLAGRTSLVIAHRLSTIRHADRILVLSAGRLVEQGAHDDLIAQNGLYAGLYKLQYEALETGGMNHVA